VEKSGWQALFVIFLCHTKIFHFAVAIGPKIRSLLLPMHIRALLFDLDDTLVVDEAVSKEALTSTAELAATIHGADAKRFQRTAAEEARRLWAEGPSHAYCRAIGISAFECLWGNFAGDSAEITQLREWAHPFRRQVFDASLREQLLDHSDGEEKLAEHFSATRRKFQRLLPDALEVLVRLKSKYKMGLLTNGAPDLQREKLAASGLRLYFDAVAVSGEHGIGKPRAEIFEILLRELGVQANQAVMIGNSLERDIAGARNAGVLPIWIQVAGAEEHADVEPAATITGLAQLPDLLAKLENEAQ